MIRFIFIIVLLLHMITCYKYSLFGFFFVFEVFNVIGTYILFADIKKNGFVKSFSVFFCYMYIVLSTIVISYFQIQAPTRDLHEYTFQEFYELSKFGTILTSAYLGGYLAFRSLISYDRTIYMAKTVQCGISNSTFRFFAIFSYIISILSWFLGITRMGEAAAHLPFHMTGILNSYRINAVPILIMLYVFDSLYHSKPISKSKFFIIFGWCLLEVFARLSKSAIVLSLTPTLIVFIINGQLNKRFFIKVIAPVLGVCLFLYPIIQNLRYADSISLSSFIEAYYDSKDDENEGSPYTRTFITGPKYMNALPLLKKDNDFFCFDRAPTIIMLGGSSAFTTFIIDGFSKDIRHRSGISGVIDPLLIGGYGLCYTMFFLFAILGLWIDRSRYCSNPLMRTFFMIFFINFVMWKNISAFMDGLVIPFITWNTLEFIAIKIYTDKNLKVSVKSNSK